MLHWAASQDYNEIHNDLLARDLKVSFFRKLQELLDDLITESLKVSPDETCVRSLGRKNELIVISLYKNKFRENHLLLMPELGEGN